MGEMTEEVFLKDVSKHAMEVLKDDGIYRHLRFAQKGEHSCSQYFNIVTWPGYLAYSGDMGCFVFSRLRDMFEFFRTDRRDNLGSLRINLNYWAEKLEAVDCHGGSSIGAAKEYSETIFKDRVNEHVNEWIEEFQGEYDSGEEEFAKQKNAFAAELRFAVKNEVLRYADDGENMARDVLRDFSCEIGGKKFKFVDTWEWDLREYTLRFVWCCYAIAWALKQYDEAKAGTTQEQH